MAQDAIGAYRESLWRYGEETPKSTEERGK